LFAETDIYVVDVPGVGQCHFDPLEIRRRLLEESDGRCWQWAQQAGQLQARLDEIEGSEATDETTVAKKAEWSMQLASIEGDLATTAFAAFRLTPIDINTGLGFTETTALRALQDFLAWMEQKKSPDADLQT
jgi:hypothetical protein